MSRFIDPRPKYVHEGATVANGKLYFWETGTTIDKTTWSDPGLTTPNANPVELDGDGRVPNIWLQGNYRVALYTSGGITEGTKIFEVDGYEGSTASSQYGDWSNVTTYSVGDFAKGSDGKYYQSLQNNNLGQEPSVSPTYWVELAFITVWNTNKEYSAGDVVLQDGILYNSIQDSNTGNVPDSSPLWWEGYAGTITAASVTYDNASSGLAATTVQSAIDEVQADAQSGTYLYAPDTGAADAYVMTLTPAITAYATGAEYRTEIANTNTGASTLNINGVAATSIRKNGTTELEAGDLPAGAIVSFAYDGTFFQLKGIYGVTATPAEINQLEGVASNVQTQLDAKYESGDNMVLGSDSTTLDYGGTARRVGWVPQKITVSSARSLANSDVGNTLLNAGHNITVPSGLQEGYVSMLVYTGSPQVIQGSGITLQWAAGGSTASGTRTISSPAFITIWIEHGTKVWIFGNGIS